MPSRRTDIDHQTGSTNYVRANTEVLRAKAEQSGPKIIESLNTRIGELVTLVASSSSYWVGDAGDLYRSTFEDAMKQFLEEVDELSTYTKELTAYADKHEGRITKSEYLAYQAQAEADAAKYI